MRVSWLVPQCAARCLTESNRQQLFTSLYSMLPTSKDYLTRAGFSPSASAYVLIGLFLGGVIAIRVVSGVIHRFIPSHVVDCAHSHDNPENDPERGEGSVAEEVHNHNRTNGSTERTPLLRPSNAQTYKSTPAVLQRDVPASKSVRRESLRAILGRRIGSLVGGVKPLCDENGPCYGFSQTCGRECTKVPPTVSPPSTMSANQISRPAMVPQHQSTRTPTVSGRRHAADASTKSNRVTVNTGYFDAISARHPNLHGAGSSSSSRSSPLNKPHAELINHGHRNHDTHSHSENHEYSEFDPPKPDGGDTHHHHVPQNAFLSIGLQTSLAIALHKLPEGFITFATNHANPTLGLTVFLALFIHNIVEGFAMALPLYLALSSRWKAMFWSSLLGGISQPAGAGLAALWIWGSGHTGHDARGPSWGVYGGMFAATAGVMSAVALQLFSEGLALTHRRGLGIGFAVAGMGLMGVSFALTA